MYVLSVAIVDEIIIYVFHRQSPMKESFVIVREIALFQLVLMPQLMLCKKKHQFILWGLSHMLGAICCAVLEEPRRCEAPSPLPGARMLLKRQSVKKDSNLQNLSLWVWIAVKIL